MLKRTVRAVRNRIVGEFTRPLQRHLVHREVGSSFDLVDVAWRHAAEDSARYFATHMLHARAFADSESVRDFAARAAAADGLILEFGVASGESINRIAAAVAPRRVQGFDSFAGLPEDWNDRWRKGVFAQAPPPVASNVELIIGLFGDTLPAFCQAHPQQRVALLHVDCDLYSSTSTIFEYLDHRIGAGTVILFDEYFNYPGWREHEYKAFQEFIARRALTYSYLAFNRRHQQVVVRIER